MGSFISTIKAYTQQKPSNPLLNTSLSKLREYHGSFKSVCDNFSIDLTEFEQIFGANESTFVIWDTDNNGLIDALELFSGLVIFSESKFEDKVKFLFDLFDFNELNSLSVIDIEFMLNCCVMSTYKIYSINSEINDEEISKFVNGSFSDENRVNISQFIKWCLKSNEIIDFFSIIKKELPPSKLGPNINDIATSMFERFVPLKKGEYIAKASEIKS